MTTLSTSEARLATSLMTLSNANELSARIIREVSGNDIADSLNGNRVTYDLSYTVAQQDFASALNLK